MHPYHHVSYACGMKYKFKKLKNYLIFFIILTKHLKIFLQIYCSIFHSTSIYKVTLKTKS